MFFSIPFASRIDEASWELKDRLLGYTLRSILRQTDPNFTVLLACHDRPTCQEMTDARVEFIKADFERATDPSQFMADKSRKRRLTANIVKARGGGYVVMQDGDDILSRNLVNFFRETNSPHGYIYPTGYVMDFATHFIAPVPGAWRKTFDRVCGSSAAIYFAPEDIGAYFAPEDIGGAKPYFQLFSQHSRWAGTASGQGRPLTEVPFPACIYMQNTSANLSAQLEQRSEERVAKLMNTIRTKTVPVTPTMIDEFSLDWLR